MIRVITLSFNQLDFISIFTDDAFQIEAVALNVMYSVHMPDVVASLTEFFVAQIATI